jgi:hypothetical protein
MARDVERWLMEVATRLFPQDRLVERTFEIEYADKIDAQNAS